jgi:hypothetical protein
MMLQGNNTLTLSVEATRSLIEEVLNRRFGVSNIRVTDVQARYSGMEIDFTTDPPAAVEPAPVPEPSHGAPVDTSLD